MTVPPTSPPSLPSASGSAPGRATVLATEPVTEPVTDSAADSAGAPAGEPVIEVSHLFTHYGERAVLKDISLTVQPGEILVIMGGSGSGKSTLLNHLLGLLHPTSGSVRVLGEELVALGEGQRSRLRQKTGVAFQGGALFSSLSVLENIMLPLREHTRLDLTTMQIMARLKMEMVNLSGAGDLMPAELSGGMIKRAALARAIVMDPRILFCDEPSAGLDPVVAAQIDDLILTLREAMQMSVVVVTHELDSAFKIADRICVLDQGEILAIGPVEEIRRSDNQRIQNLLNRRVEMVEPDPDEYLSRLTGLSLPLPVTPGASGRGEHGRGASGRGERGRGPSR